MRRPCERKSQHGAEYCSRACHYQGRSAGLTKRVVAEPYDIPPEVRAQSSASAARRYAAGTFGPIPETEIRTSAALGAAGIHHVHQHVIDLGDRSVAVDLFFPDQMLVVEIDAPALHRKRAVAAADAKRDADLAAAGYTVKRVLDDRNVPAILGRVLQALA